MADSIDWTDDTPRRLSVIAKLAFPDGGMTASSLRREAERGRLAVERIAGERFHVVSGHRGDAKAVSR
jgi:hypothetical protein